MNLSGVYRAARRIAGDVIGGAGELVEYVHPGTISLDPWLGEVQPTETHHSVRAVFEPVAAHLIDGTAVQSGDEWALIAADALPVVPVTGGRIEAVSRTLQVVRVETLRPGGLAITYRLQVRR